LSNKTKKGLSEFKELILTGASKLSLLKTEVPYSYEVTAQRCRATKDKGIPYLTWNEFKVLVADLGTEDTVLRSIAAFMHEAGVIIWFNQVRSPFPFRLNFTQISLSPTKLILTLYLQPQICELVILSPEWLANVMSSIVSFKARWAKGSSPHPHLPLGLFTTPTHNNTIFQLQKYHIKSV